jgi:hypothetical protein
MAGVVALASPGSQQNVSRFHNLQLRFSKRLPSPNELAHLEKTMRRLDNERRSLSKGNLPLHMEYRFSTLRVSTLRMRLASTVKTGVSNIEGMLVLNARVVVNLKTRLL